MEKENVQFSELPFAAWRAAPRVMAGPHVHTDIELNLLITGGVTYFHAGRFYTVPARRLAVFWAGMPHRLIAVEAGAEYFCMTLPLAWFLGWNLGGALPSRLLTGELIQETSLESAALDFALMERWAQDLKRDGNGGAETRRIALLEVEARLRRLGLRPHPLPPSPADGRGGIRGNDTIASSLPVLVPPLPSEGEGGRGWGRNPSRGHQMERIADYIGRHYREPLTLAGIAAAVNLNPNYAATAFREGSGLSVWEYVTRLRISHAQRLLLTTDWTAARIALDCGFTTSTRFFAAFKRLCGLTPLRYRKR